MNALKLFPPASAEVPAEVWLAGAPSHVAPALVAADRRIYAQARCPACGRRGLKTEAQHCGNRYRIVGRCRWCGRRETY